jgi:hypothetical protein
MTAPEKLAQTFLQVSPDHAEILRTTKGGTLNTTSSPGSAERNSGIVNRVKETATSQLSAQKDKATEGLGSVAQAVRQTTQTLRDQKHDTDAQYVERAANQIERLNAGLKNKDVTELLDDAQRLARQQPALFIGGAFALGLVGARFLKSSSPEPTHFTGYDRNSESGSYGSTAYVSGGTSRAYAPQTPATPSAAGTREAEKF